MHQLKSLLFPLLRTNSIGSEIISNHLRISIQNNKSVINQVRYIGMTKFPDSVPDSFKASDVSIQTLNDSERAVKPDWNKLVFGHHYTDHMLEIEWNGKKGWSKPRISPVHNLSFHPFSKVFHYSPELFEGLKAYKSKEGKILMFRPDLNMNRMRNSSKRLCLPDFDGEELIKLIKKLIQIDESWVPPYETRASLYIRPTLIGTEPALGVSPSGNALLFVVTSPVGPYFGTGALKPVSLLADPQYVRAWPGGSGDSKLGSNYAPTLLVQEEAKKKGCQQVLWLFGPDHELTEVGTMNIFVFLKRKDGGKELITPPLGDGLILPGVTRISLLEMCREWNEFDVVERKITMKELQELMAEDRLLEVFGAGTACVVCPVGDLNYNGERYKFPEPNLALRLNKELTGIQYGDIEHKWAFPIDS